MNAEIMDMSARSLWIRLTVAERKQLIEEFKLPERFVREPLRPSMGEISADAVHRMSQMVNKKGK